jgi:nucleoid-associated protein YgaU
VTTSPVPPVPTSTAGAVAPERFPPSSRYAGTAVEISVDSDGTEHRYLTRRFIGAADGVLPLARHLVVSGDRLDLLSQRYYGDPLLSWRICDANRALDPDALTATAGDVLTVPAPDLSAQFGGTP